MQEAGKVSCYSEFEIWRLCIWPVVAIFVGIDVKPYLKYTFENDVRYICNSVILMHVKIFVVRFVHIRVHEC